MRGTLHVARRSSSTSSSGEVSGELAGGGGDNGGGQGGDSSHPGVVLLSALPRGAHGQDAAITGGVHGRGGHQQVSTLTTPMDDSIAVSSMANHDTTSLPYGHVSKTLPRNAKFSQNDDGGAISQDYTSYGANGVTTSNAGVKARPKSSAMKNLKLKLRRKSSGELPIGNTAVPKSPLTPEESGEPPPFQLSSSGEKEKKARRGLLGSKTLSRSMENLFKRNKLSKAATIDIGEPVAFIPCYDENHRPQRLTKGTASSQAFSSGGSFGLHRSQSLDNLDDGDVEDLTVTSGYEKTRSSVITGVGVSMGLNRRRQTGIITNGSIPRPQGAPPPVPTMGSATRRLRSRSLDLSSHQRQVILTAINIDDTPADGESNDNDDAFLDDSTQGNIDHLGNRNIHNGDQNTMGEISNASNSVAHDRHNSDYSDFSDYSEYSNCSSFHNSSSIYSSGSANNYTVNPPVTDHLYGNIATIFQVTSNVNNNNDDNDDDYGWSDDDDEVSSTHAVVTENLYGNATVVAAALAGLTDKCTEEENQTEGSKPEGSSPQLTLTQHLKQHLQKRHGQHSMLHATAALEEVNGNSNSTVEDSEDTYPLRESSPVLHMPAAHTMTKTSTFSRNDAIQQDRSRDCPAVPPGDSDHAVPLVPPGESAAAGAVLEENSRQDSVPTGGVNANAAVSADTCAAGGGVRTAGQEEKTTPGGTWRSRQELPPLPQQSPPGGDTHRQHPGLGVRQSTPPGGTPVGTGSRGRTLQGKRRATTVVRPSVPPPQVPPPTPEVRPATPEVLSTTVHAKQRVVAHGRQYSVDDSKDGISVCDDLEFALRQFDDIISDDEDDGTKLYPETDSPEENVNNDKKEDLTEEGLRGRKLEQVEIEIHGGGRDHDIEITPSDNTKMGLKSKNVLLKIKQLEEGKLARGKHWEGGREEVAYNDSRPNDDLLTKGRKGILKPNGDRGKLGAGSQAVGMLLERKQKEQGVSQGGQKQGWVQEDGKGTTVVAFPHATTTPHTLEEHTLEEPKLGLSQSSSPQLHHHHHHHQKHHNKTAGTTGAPHNKPALTINKNPDITHHNNTVSGATGSESTLSEVGLKTHLKPSHDHHQTTADSPTVQDGAHDSTGDTEEDHTHHGIGTNPLVINPKEDVLQQELKSHIHMLRQRSGLAPTTHLSANSHSVEEEIGGDNGEITVTGEGTEQEGEKGCESGRLVSKGMVPQRGPAIPVPKKPSGLMARLVKGTPQVTSSSDSFNVSQPTTSATPVHKPLTAPKTIKTKAGMMTRTDRYGNNSNNWQSGDSVAPGGIPAHAGDRGGVGVKGGGGAMAISSPDHSLEGPQQQQQQQRPPPFSLPTLPLSQVLSSGALAARRREMIGVSSGAGGGGGGDSGGGSGSSVPGHSLGSHLKISSTATGKDNTYRSTKVTSHQDITSSTSSNDVTNDVDTSGGSIADRIKLLSSGKSIQPGGGPQKLSKPSVPPKSAQTVRKFREKVSSSGSERRPSSCSERSLSPSWSPDRLTSSHRLMQGTSEDVFSCHDNEDAGYAQCGLNATSAAYIRSNTPRGFSPRSPTTFKFNIGPAGPKSPQAKVMSNIDSQGKATFNSQPGASEAAKSGKSLLSKAALGKVPQNKSQLDNSQATISQPGKFSPGKSQKSKSPERQRSALTEVAMYAKVNKMSANPSLQLVATGERGILTPSQIKARVQARGKTAITNKWNSNPPDLPAKPTGLKPDPPPKSKPSDKTIGAGTPGSDQQLNADSSENKPRAIIKRRPTLPKKPSRILARLRSHSAEDLLNMDPLGTVGVGEGGGDEVYSDGEDVYNDVGTGSMDTKLPLPSNITPTPPSNITTMTSITSTTTTTDFSPDTYDDIDVLTTRYRDLHNRQLPAVPTGGECKTQADAGVDTLHHNSLYADDSELAARQDGDYNIDRRRATTTGTEVAPLHEKALSGSDKGNSTAHTSNSLISSTNSVQEEAAVREDIYEDIGSPTRVVGTTGTGVNDTSSKAGRPWSSSHSNKLRRKDQYEQVCLEDSEEEGDNKVQKGKEKRGRGGKKGGQEKGSGSTQGDTNLGSQLSLPVSRAEGIYEELPDPDDPRSSSSAARRAAARGDMADSTTGSDRRTQAPVARIQPFRHAYDEVCIDDDGNGNPTIINTNPPEPPPNKPSTNKHLSKLANLLKQNKLNFNKSKTSQEAVTESEAPPPSKLKISLSSPCINSGGEFFPNEEQLGMSSHPDRKLAKRTSLGGATTTSSVTEDTISVNSYTDSISSMGSTPGGLNGDGEGDANWRRDRRQVRSLTMDEQLMEGNEQMGGRGYSSADSLSIHSGSDSTMSADSASTGEAKMTHDDHMKHLAKVNQKVNKSLGARHLSKLYVSTLKEKTATLKEKTSNIRNLPKYFSKSASSLQLASRKSLGDISGQMQRMLRKSKAPQPSAPTPDYTSEDFSDDDGGWSDTEFDGPEYEETNGPVIMNCRPMATPPTCTTNTRSGLTIEASYLHPPPRSRGMPPPKPPTARQHRPLPPPPQQAEDEVEEDYLAPSNPILAPDIPSPQPPRYPAPIPPGQVPMPPWKAKQQCYEEEQDQENYEEMDVASGSVGPRANMPVPRPPIGNSNSPSNPSASIINALNGLKKTGQGPQIPPKGAQAPPKPPIGSRPEMAPKPSTFPKPPPKPLAKPPRLFADAGGVPPVPNARGAAAANPGGPPPREVNGVGGGDMRSRALAGAKKLPTLPDKEDVGYRPNLKSPEINKKSPWKDSTPARAPSPPSTQSIPTFHRAPPMGGAPPMPTPPRPHRGGPGGPPSIPSPRQPPLAVTPQSDLDGLYSYYWFHGTMTREQVTERLYSINTDGTYILRRSNKGGKDNPYTLSILYNEKVWNLHIRLRNDNTYALGNFKDNEKTFSSVPELVDYHTQRNLILAGSRGGETVLKNCPSVVKRTQ